MWVCGLFALSLLTIFGALRCVYIFFFFFKQKTAYEMRISDWSQTCALPIYLGPNNAMRRHMFESLLLTDENQRLSPGLAVSYEPLDDTTWEFKLREGVTFHDGSPFTARDVVFTVCRIPTVENSPSSFSVYTKGIAGMAIGRAHV